MTEDNNDSKTPFFVEGQWPKNITKGFLRYSPATNYSGFSLSDASHGIPTVGAVEDKGSVSVFNYPGQTEEIARRLVACWNACVGIPIEELEARVAILKNRNRPSHWTDRQWEEFDNGNSNPSPQ